MQRSPEQKKEQALKVGESDNFHHKSSLSHRRICKNTVGFLTDKGLSNIIPLFKLSVTAFLAPPFVQFLHGSIFAAFCMLLCLYPLAEGG